MFNLVQYLFDLYLQHSLPFEVKFIFQTYHTYIPLNLSAQSWQNFFGIFPNIPTFISTFSIAILGHPYPSHILICPAISSFEVGDLFNKHLLSLICLITSLRGHNQANHFSHD